MNAFTRATFSRRQFIRHATHGAALCVLPRLAPTLAASVLNLRGSTADPLILVLLHLEGGNDGFNTVVPFHDDDYYRSRPTLALHCRDLIALSETAALNRACAALEPLFKGGKLAIVQNVGYRGQSESHFRSTEIWATASASEDVVYSGWIGRCFSNRPSGSRVVTGFHSPGKPPRIFWREKNHTDAHKELAGNGVASMVRLALTAPAGEPGVMLAEIAECAGKTDGDEIYSVSVGGFDTHFHQAARHAERLKRVSDALFAFQQRLEQRGVGRRTVTMVSSEFGRSLRENAQGGTDHGAGAPVFLMGESVRGGIHHDDKNALIDFRRLIATVSNGWLNVPAHVALAGALPSEEKFLAEFKMLNVFASPSAGRRSDARERADLRRSPMA